MAVGNYPQASNYVSVGYGLSTALPGLYNPPIVAARAPTTADKYQIGQIWVYSATNTSYILTSIVNNAASWQTIGGAASFSSLAVTGNATIGGTLIVTGVVTASTGLTISANGLSITAGGATITGATAVTGALSATTTVKGETLLASGDAGGLASTTGITNVTNTTQSTGALTIKSTTGNNETNTGLLKFYVGTTAVYVPYFTTIG